MINKWRFVLAIILIFLVGCSQQSTANDTGNSNQPSVSIEEITAVSVPPTFTPLSKAERLMTAQPQVTVTQNPLPTVATDTPVPFGETAVELRYTIPSVGLDRRLQGSVSSQIIFADETTGELLKRDNQSTVLIELQRILPELVLEPLPAGCANCVYVSYNLPFSDERDDGWLQDPTILASIENYLNFSLGTHFPPDTIFGLRRNASPYAPAHTIAVTADGLQYIWLATEAEVMDATAANPQILEALSTLDINQLGQQYHVTCVGTPTETMYVKNEEVSKWIGLTCPEYAIPTTLQPLYLAVDEAITAKLATNENVVERPPVLFPLNGILDYQRVDGAQLTILNDGTAVAISPSQQTVTTTLTTTDVLSLTTTLLESNQLKLGLTSFFGDPSAAEATTENATATPVPPRSVLLLRAPEGVYDGFWDNTSNVELLAPLNQIVNQLLGDLLDETPIVDETPAPEETPNPDGTPSPDATPSPETTATETPET